MGKTRMVGEVVAGAEWRGFQVGVARATPQITLPYQIVRDALVPLLTPLRVAQLAELMEPVWLSAIASILPLIAEHLPDIVPLAPLEHHEEQRRLWDGLARCLLGLASVAPLLLVLEDIHWADEATLAAFVHLVSSLPANRVFIILTYRTAEARERAVVWETLDGLDRALPPLRLHLVPFELAETADLLGRALGTTSGSRFAVMAERLHREMGGNALFLVESLKALVEQGDLALSDGEWIFPLDDVSLPAPTSVQDLIEERLVRLPPALRATLELIAVLGENADFTTLARFSGDIVALLPTLTALGQRGFLFEAESTYRFEHERIGEIVYQAIERERRLMLHRQVGTVLEELYPERVEALAYHFDLGEVWEKALAYTVQAAERASAVHAYPAALERYHRAVALVPLAGADDVRRFDLLAAREGILDVLGRRQEQADDLEALEHLAQGDLQRMAEVLRRRAWLLMHTGRYEEAEDVASQALHLAQQENCEAIEAAVLTAMGTLTNWSSKPAQAVPYLEQAIQHYLQLGDIKGEADARCNLAGALLGIKAYDDVASELERALSLYTSLKDRLQIIEVLNLLGILYMERGNLADAVACYERALGTAREIGYLYGEARILCNLGNLSYVQGQIDKALALYDEVVPLFEALGERRGEAQVRINRASVHCSFFGGSEVALADAETALAHYREMGEAIGQGQCLSVLGQIALQRGQLVRARTYLEEGGRLVLDAGERWIGVHIYCLLADLTLEEGSPGDALRYVEEVETICSDLGLEALAVAVLSLRGLVLLALGQQDAALEASNRAMEQLSSGVEQAYLVPFRHYQVLCALRRDEEARVAIERAYELLFEAIGGLSPEQQGVSLERVPEHRAIVEAWESCQPRCVVVRLPRVDAPTGRSLRDEELVSVTWTVAAPEDDAIEGKAKRRCHRLLRLFGEAAAQSAAPTVVALADALDVSERTVKRDLSALRAEGRDVRTRGFRS
ncbi:MAG: tetratricopeptide repeat protein [Anaerolineae bacterium]